MLVSVFRVLHCLLAAVDLLEFADLFGIELARWVSMVRTAGYALSPSIWRLGKSNPPNASPSACSSATKSELNRFSIQVVLLVGWKNVVATMSDWGRVTTMTKEVGGYNCCGNSIGCGVWQYHPNMLQFQYGLIDYWDKSFDDRGQAFISQKSDFPDWEVSMFAAFCVRFLLETKVKIVKLYTLCQIWSIASWTGWFTFST